MVQGLSSLMADHVSLAGDDGKLTAMVGISLLIITVVATVIVLITVICFSGIMAAFLKVAFKGFTSGIS